MKSAELKRYDGKCLRLTDRDGEVFEGLCWHEGREYCLHEYGRDEACLRMGNFLFFPRDIACVEILTQPGPWGVFSGPWGRLEELNLLDGFDSVQEELEFEETIYPARMLACLEDALVRDGGTVLPWRDQLQEMLRTMAAHHPEPDIRQTAERLIGLI